MVDAWPPDGVIPFPLEHEAPSRKFDTEAALDEQEGGCPLFARCQASRLSPAGWMPHLTSTASDDRTPAEPSRKWPISHPRLSPWPSATALPTYQLSAIYLYLDRWEVESRQATEFAEAS